MSGQALHEPPEPRAEESRFLAGGRLLPWDLSVVLKLFIELLSAFRRFRSLGPCVIVVGSRPEGLRWADAVAACEGMGTWLASQGFTVLTLGEAGLSERVARSCERVGGRAVRCPLGARRSASPALLIFEYELTRRLVLAKFSYATIALAPTGETSGMLHFLLALSRFGRLPDYRLYVLHEAQWTAPPWKGEPLATRPIESAADLADGFDSLLSA
jgi:hypothetical protein